MTVIGRKKHTSREIGSGAWPPHGDRDHSYDGRYLAPILSNAACHEYIGSACANKKDDVSKHMQVMCVRLCELVWYFVAAKFCAFLSHRLSRYP